jgi:hypothetical protein
MITPPQRMHVRLVVAPWMVVGSRVRNKVYAISEVMIAQLENNVRKKVRNRIYTKEEV